MASFFITKIFLSKRAFNTENPLILKCKNLSPKFLGRSSKHKIFTYRICEPTITNFRGTSL